MKLSIAWIFDHIEKNWKELDIPELIAQFSVTTAEIEEVRKAAIKTDNLTLVSIKELSPKGIVVESPELKKELLLPERKDSVSTKSSYYLVKKEQKRYQWVTLADLGSEKEGLLPSLYCPQELIKGDWKKDFEETDYVITLDNKAITNRPDMWGHRGFAREIAALINAQLRPEEYFLASKPIKHYTQLACVSSTSPFTLEISPESNGCGQPCKRLAGLYIPKIEFISSLLPIAHRLARIDAKPLNALVDFTNYVMFDIGQPMHAFDAKAISTNKIIARCAHEGETLELLDGQIVTLTSLDYVITDGKRPIALAGIMGGRASAITEKTGSLFVESANFDASGIRRTSARIKKRTEASARFEKSLDPNNNTHALLRFLKLLDDYKINYHAADAIASVGPLFQEKLIEVSHKFICDRLGTYISPEKVELILTKLGFGVQAFSNDNGVKYTITVPTYRAAKDITIPEDIVEEVARFIGYYTIPLQLPERQMVPFDSSQVYKLRAIKNHMAFALGMHEVQTYAFYDEEFLRKIQYNPVDALRVASPQSENWQRLITSLVPNLLKAIYINSNKQESWRFFEYNRVWFLEKKPIERKELAGIFYTHKQRIDFYHAKAQVNSLFQALSLPIEWAKPTKTIAPWYDNYQIAELKYNNRIIGLAGKVSANTLAHIAEGEAFIFELDAGFLLKFVPATVKFKPLHKYPEVHFDISVLVPYTVTVAQLEQAIKSADSRITQVYLLDMFEKPEWADRKSLTFRLITVDPSKTLTKEEIDTLWNAVVSNVQKYDATIR